MRTRRRTRRDDAHRAFHAAVVGLADNRQLDIALEPILLKLQLPMAMNLREEARHHRASDGIERHQAILSALETNDPAVVIAALRRPRPSALSRALTSRIANTIDTQPYRDRHHSVDNRQLWLMTRTDRRSARRSRRSWRRMPAGPGSPTKTAARVADAIAARGDDGTWLSTVPRDDCSPRPRRSRTVPARGRLPLYGVPFGVKDSIDVEGVPTTLSCPDYAYVATDDRAGGAAAARRRRAVRRQDQPRPVRDRTERHPHAVHGPAQRLRRRDDLGRFEFRLGAGGRAGPGAVRGRDRHRRIGPGARRAQRRRRVQAVARV